MLKILMYIFIFIIILLYSFVWYLVKALFFGINQEDAEDMFALIIKNMSLSEDNISFKIKQNKN